MNSCSIIVNSCDKFSAAWQPFFLLLQNYWPNCPYKKYLNTETLSYNDFEVVTLNSDEKSWTGRLIDSLMKIDTDYVLFTLEDFFLMAPVKEKAIEEIIDCMKKDSNIAVVYPKKISGFKERDKEHPGWIRMDFSRNNKYLVNCQFGIWSRRALLEILKPNMSPWELEREYRIPEDCKYKFYCSPDGDKFSVEGDVFPYLFAIQNGYGIAQSKWLWNNKKFFKREKIDVNFKELGTLSYPHYLIMRIIEKIKLWRKKIIK